MRLGCDFYVYHQNANFKNANQLTVTSVPPTILVLASPQEQEDRGQHGDVEELGVKYIRLICNIFVDNCNVVVFLLAMYEECRVQIGDREGPSLQKGSHGNDNDHLLSFEECGRQLDHGRLVSPRVSVITSETKQHLDLRLVKVFAQNFYPILTST